LRKKREAGKLNLPLMEKISDHSPASLLAAALRERQRIIADEASRKDSEAHLARLQRISEEVVRLGNQLPQPVDPQLGHFLARCSYDKALALLETL
jgi:hypothetical protein